MKSSKNSENLEKIRKILVQAEKKTKNNITLILNFSLGAVNQVKDYVYEPLK